MNPKPKPQNFEEAFGALQAVVEKLESDRISLEEALSAYEHGMELLRRCTEILDLAQLRVEQLTKDTEGVIHTEDIGPSLEE